MVEGRLEAGDRRYSSKSLTVKRILRADALRYQKFSSIELRLDASRCTEEMLGELVALLQRHKGGDCRPRVLYRNGGAEGAFLFPEEWNVRPSEEFLLQLQSRFGESGARYV